MKILNELNDKIYKCVIHYCETEWHMIFKLQNRGDLWIDVIDKWRDKKK